MLIQNAVLNACFCLKEAFTVHVIILIYLNILITIFHPIDLIIAKYQCTSVLKSKYFLFPFLLVLLILNKDILTL